MVSEGLRKKLIEKGIVYNCTTCKWHISGCKKKCFAFSGYEPLPVEHFDNLKELVIKFNNAVKEIQEEYGKQ